MKFKKLLLLPLAALLLNGCAIGKKVDKDVANERVSEAIQTQEEMDVDSLFQEAKQDITESVSQTNLGAETTSKVTNKGTTTLKAKDLLGENPQVVASAKATAMIKMGKKIRLYQLMKILTMLMDGFIMIMIINSVVIFNYRQRAGKAK